MSSLLTPDFGLLFWMVITFTIVLILLSRFGFPVITKSVQKRSEYIHGSLKVADEANRRLASIKTEADELINGARQQQAQILKKAVTDGEGIVRTANERAASETEKQMMVARDRLAIQKKKAMAEINSEVADMAIFIAEKVLRTQLEDPQTQEKLIMAMLDEMEGIDKEGEKLN